MCRVWKDVEKLGGSAARHVFIGEIAFLWNDVKTLATLSSLLP